MKKFYITLFATLFIMSLLIATYSFATENSTIAQDMKNMMNGVENTAQDMGQGIVNGTKNVVNNGKNIMENMTDGMQNGVQNAGNTISGEFTDNNDYSSYTATRTATTTNNNFLGMGPNMLTWIIMAIVGVAIIGLVWYYAKEHEIDYNE